MSDSERPALDEETTREQEQGAPDSRTIAKVIPFRTRNAKLGKLPVEPTLMFIKDKQSGTTAIVDETKAIPMITPRGVGALDIGQRTVELTEAALNGQNKVIEVIHSLWPNGMAKGIVGDGPDRRDNAPKTRFDGAVTFLMSNRELINAMSKEDAFRSVCEALLNVWRLDYEFVVTDHLVQSFITALGNENTNAVTFKNLLRIADIADSTPSFVYMTKFIKMAGQSKSEKASGTRAVEIVEIVTNNLAKIGLDQQLISEAIASGETYEQVLGIFRLIQKPRQDSPRLDSLDGQARAAEFADHLKMKRTLLTVLRLYRNSTGKRRFFDLLVELNNGQTLEEVQQKLEDALIALE